MRNPSAFRRAWRALLAGAMAAGVASPALATDEPPRLSPIQLHAPAEEFLDGTLREPDYSKAGDATHTAFVPMYFEEQNGEWVWEGEALVDSAEDLSIFFIGEDSINWDVTLQPPGEAPMDRSSFRARPSTKQEVAELFFLGPDAPAVDGFRTQATAPGKWRVRAVSHTRPVSRSSSRQHGGQLMVINDSPEKAYTHLVGRDHVVGGQAVLNTYVMDYDVFTMGKAPEEVWAESPAARGAKMVGVASRVTATVYAPDGSSRVVPMLDDGRHSDGAAGDGVFGLVLDLEQAGEYLAEINTLGRNPEGREFLRTNFVPVSVIERDAQFEGGVVATVESDTSLRLDFPVRATQNAGKVRLAAEVWGTDERGQELPVCWIGCVGMPRVENGQEVVQMRLDARWLTYAGAQAPFQLRNVRMEDTVHFIPMSRIESTTLRLDRLPSRAASQPVSEITEDMKIGLVSDAYSLPLGEVAQSYWDRSRGSYTPGQDPQLEIGSHSLFMSHGFCSDNVWGQADSEITEPKALLFDLGVSRPHMEFAEILFCATEELKSFGLVGHSQGGPASLTLFTYFYSGLHWARGPGSRRIQSVGSPYLGSPLANAQSAIDWLPGPSGPCPLNTSLRTADSEAWLAGIPMGHRADVYYYATHEANDSILVDHCHTLSSAYMIGDDDGAVPVDKTVLAGGNSMGITSGQCHTFSMNDPGQCGHERRLDDGSIVTHSRNPTFSSNAMR